MGFFDTMGDIMYQFCDYVFREMDSKARNLPPDKRNEYLAKRAEYEERLEAWRESKRA